MKLALIVIGKSDKGFVSDGIKEYQNRLGRYVKFDLTVIPDVKKAGSLPPEKLMEKEAELIKKYTRNYQKIYLLDENGKKFSSEGLANFVNDQLISNYNEICFVIGGAYGFDESIKKMADGSLSLSDLTFSHQMVRMIFVEQLYRAFTILNNEPYHHR